MVFMLLRFCFSFHGMLLLDSLGSRRGVVGGTVDSGRCVPLVASPERSAAPSAVVQFILPV